MLRLAEARAEAEFYEARSDAISAGGPFDDPGAGAENALLDVTGRLTDVRESG